MREEGRGDATSAACAGCANNGDIKVSLSGRLLVCFELLTHDDRHWFTCLVGDETVTEVELVMSLGCSGGFDGQAGLGEAAVYEVAA
ncbi:hypothetical protein, partial [Streptomyces sp. NPDC047841]|uniref:hypothetical protein n=1 Tax=Streptomyces sp. NPDC047841 TaxID=3154708 RepID=UPI0034571E55